MTSIRRPPPEVPYGSGTQPYVEQHDRARQTKLWPAALVILILVGLAAIGIYQDGFFPHSTHNYAEDN